MTEMSTYKDTDRVIFNHGKQGDFIAKARKKCGLNWTEFSNLLGMHPRLLLYYRKEGGSISYKRLKLIMTVSGVKLPHFIEIKDQYWNKASSGKLGGEAIIKKYGKVGGNEEYRKTQWKKWWDTTGKKKPNSITTKRVVKIPTQSQELAELCGILIGDGGISKYQVTITLNGETDRVYSEFVTNLIEKLFEVSPKVYEVKNSKAINIVVSRSNLVDFLISLGMKLGHKLKQNVSIPDWIMESKKYRIACMRGMVDTDGSVVLETHRIKNKTYTYPRLNFTSASPSLIKQTMGILTELNFSPKLRRGGRSVQLENLDEICQYFNVVGSSNPKHLARISPWY
jgi:transcriptional regulator with XRE-family HTH domain